MGLKMNFLWHFLPIFLTHLVLLDLLKLFQNPASWHECSPIYGLCFIYIYIYYPLYKRGVRTLFKTHCGLGGLAAQEDDMQVVFGPGVQGEEDHVQNCRDQFWKLEAKTNLCTHTFRSSHWFLEVPPKKGFEKIICWNFLIGSTKTQLKNIKFGMVVNWHNFFL